MFQAHGLLTHAIQILKIHIMQHFKLTFVTLCGFVKCIKHYIPADLMYTHDITKKKGIHIESCNKMR